MGLRDLRISGVISQIMANWLSDANGSAYVTVKTDVTHPGLLSDADSVTLTATGDGSDLIVARSTPGGGVTFNITGLTAETVTLKSYLDAGQTIETPALLPIDHSTGLPAASGSLGNGSYTLNDSSGLFWHFEKSSTTETPVITYVGTGK